MSSNKKWEGCRTCENARRRASGNISCKVENANDGLDFNTRRELAHVNNGCEYYKGVDPIEQLERIKAAKGKDTSAGSGETAQEVDPMKTPLWDIDNIFLNPFAELPPVLTWCKMGERPAIPCKGVISFSAKPKQGKSLSCYALMTSLISGKEFDTIKPIKTPRLVVVFDTEMDNPTLQSRAVKMVDALGENAPRFQIVPLLAIAKKDRLKVIEEVTAKYNPDIVIIDQVARLVDDFNNSGENVAFGEWLTQYAAQRTAMVVIHQNKAADNKQMKGHLGSIIEELAIENYSVARNGRVFKVTPTNARTSMVDDESASFEFALDEETGKYITATSINEAAERKERQEWISDLKPIFGDDETLRYSEIVKRIVDRQQISDTAADTKIDNAKKCGALIKTGEGNRDPYKLASE